MKNRANYGRWICKNCNLIFETRALLYLHYKQNHSERKRFEKGLSPWNKGLTKDNSDVIKNACIKISNSLKNKPGHKHSEKTRQHLSEMAFKRSVPRSTKHTEAYVCKDGTVVKLDSSYERTLAKILDDNDIKWIRPTSLTWYSKDGVKHQYYPDFYLVDYNVYLDPKNEYCFKVQAEKINYILRHYDNCIFLHKEQLTKENIFKILEEQ